MVKKWEPLKKKTAYWHNIVFLFFQAVSAMSTYYKWSSNRDKIGKDE